MGEEKMGTSPEQRALRYGRHGLTEEQYAELLKAQGGKCAICGTRDPGGQGARRSHGWHVDHDHACCPTGTLPCGKCIRGLLCHNCNIGLGHFHDDRDFLQSAIDYLTRTTYKD
jgi:hypothetical protein